jgi:hypothetical protein
VAAYQIASTWFPSLVQPLISQSRCTNVASSRHLHDRGPANELRRATALIQGIPNETARPLLGSFTVLRWERDDWRPHSFVTKHMRIALHLAAFCAMMVLAATTACAATDEFKTKQLLLWCDSYLASGSEGESPGVLCAAWFEGRTERASNHRTLPSPMTWAGAGNSGNLISASGFGHVKCGGTEDQIATSIGAAVEQLASNAQ